MREIYAVSVGDYSDYQVLALFEQRKDAEEFVKHLRKFSSSKWMDTYEQTGNASVEAGIVDDDDEGDYYIYASDAYVEQKLIYGPGETPKPVAVYCVRVDRSGKETNRWLHQEWPWDVNYEYVYADHDGATACSTRGYDAALKAARDKLYARKARRKGLD